MSQDLKINVQKTFLTNNQIKSLIENINLPFERGIKIILKCLFARMNMHKHALNANLKDITVIGIVKINEAKEL